VFIEPQCIAMFYWYVLFTSMIVTLTGPIQLIMHHATIVKTIVWKYLPHSLAITI